MVDAVKYDPIYNSKWIYLVVVGNIYLLMIHDGPYNYNVHNIANDV